MRSLPCPTYDLRTIVGSCVDSISDPDAKDRLTNSVEALVAAETVYAIHGSRGDLFAIATTDGIGRMTAIDMENIYKQTFVRSRRVRHIYDALKKAAPNDVCPLCGQRTVGTLDHYLPQSLHSALAITPLNLVPACSDCNKNKRDIQPASADEQTLHPYFDNLDGGVWLHAEVQPVAPAVVRFSVRPPANWDDTLRRRVEGHFEQFKLEALYGSHSAVEINNIRYGLLLIERGGGWEAVRGHLALVGESCASAHQNSWQSAMYRALAGSEWFCRGGFQ